MNSDNPVPQRLFTRKFGIFIALCFVVVAVGAITYLVIFNQAPVDEIVERELARVEALVEQNPDDPNSRVELGLLYFEAGSHKQAIDQLKTALELDETHQGALVVLGDIYVELGRYQEALEPYSKVVELNQDNPMRHVSKQLEGVYYFLGVAYFNLGRPEEAVQSLKEALNIDWTDSDAWYMLGASHQHLGECEEAIESFTQAIRFIPNFKEAYQGLAQCYRETGQSNFAAYADAMVRYSSGAWDDAARQLEDIVTVTPDFTEAYLGLGLAYEKQGRIGKAIAAFQNALQLDPDLWLAQAKLEALGAE